MQQIDSTTLPIHPRTGRSAVGIVNGKPVWPILGGSGEGGDGGDGGDDGKGGGADTYTAPASQADLDRIVQDRLGRERKQYGMTPEEAKAFKERAEALENDLSSETEKAVKKAAAEARTAAMDSVAPNLVRQAFRAEAKGVLDKDQLDGLLEDYNPKNYLNDDGTVDEEKVAARVAKLAGKNDGKNDGKNGKPPLSLGQGKHQGTSAQPGDQGRAMAQKRFGSKK